MRKITAVLAGTLLLLGLSVGPAQAAPGGKAQPQTVSWEGK
ncbi:hypothetical protein [Ornithinicoccus halotolerans]|nr:hypothetical protein [Ornithinicoccus halotolerans]